MQKLLKRYRYSLILLRQLVKTDFKLRYQGSALGYVWSLLRPLFLFTILYFVFAKFLGVGDDIPHFPIYLLLGVVLWNYFTEITTGSIAAIVGKSELIRKINFPKYIIVIAGCVAAIINLLLNSIVIGVFMFISGVDTGIQALLVLPLLLELTLLALGFAFLLSALYVRLRDVGYIWEVLMQAAFYATPILYPLSLVLDKANDTVAKLMILNPVAQIMQDMRYVLVTPEALHISDLYVQRAVWLIPVGLSLLVFVTGALYFRKKSKYFAEEV